MISKGDRPGVSTRSLLAGKEPACRTVKGAGDDEKFDVRDNALPALDTLHIAPCWIPLARSQLRNPPAKILLPEMQLAPASDHSFSELIEFSVTVT